MKNGSAPGITKNGSAPGVTKNWGAPLLSGAERYFRTESESPWVTGAASSGRRKVDLVERNASVALKTAVTSRRRDVGGRAEGWGWDMGRRAGPEIATVPPHPLYPWV